MKNNYPNGGRKKNSNKVKLEKYCTQLGMRDLIKERKGQKVLETYFRGKLQIGRVWEKNILTIT